MSETVLLPLDLLKFSFLVSVIFASIRYYETAIFEKKEYILGIIKIDAFSNDYSGNKTIKKLNSRLNFSSKLVSFLTILFICYLFTLIYIVMECDYFPSPNFDCWHKTIISIILFTFCILLGYFMLIEKKFNEIKSFINNNDILT